MEGYLVAALLILTGGLMIAISEVGRLRARVTNLEAKIKTIAYHTMPGFFADEDGY